MSKLQRLKRRDWNEYELTKALGMPIVKRLEEYESSFNLEDIASLEEARKQRLIGISKALPKYK